MIYTKRGDDGTTTLLGGAKVSKADLRVECYGTVDELIAYLGLIRDCLNSDRLTAELVKIQTTLFTLGNLLACEDEEKYTQLHKVTKDDVKFLERKIDAMEADLAQITEFVIPGGSRTASHAHVARTICRRAERLCVRLDEQNKLECVLLEYLNRLSDYLFVFSRMIVKNKARKETYYKPR